MRVDLPAPFSPKNACMPPVFISQVTVSLARTLPNLLVISSNRTDREEEDLTLRSCDRGSVKHCVCAILTITNRSQDSRRQDNRTTKSHKQWETYAIQTLDFLHKALYSRATQFGEDLRQSADFDRLRPISVLEVQSFNHVREAIRPDRTVGPAFFQVIIGRRFEPLEVAHTTGQKHPA